MSALRTAQKAVDTRDSSLFTQAVDIDSVLNKGADALITFVSQAAAEGTITSPALSMAAMLLNSGADSAQRALVVSLLGSEVRSFLATGINGGYFAGDPDPNVKPSSASLASALEKMPKGRRVLEPGKVLSEDNGKARVSATFVDPGAGRVPLVLVLERKEGNWKVTEIANASDVFKKSIHGK